MVPSPREVSGFYAGGAKFLGSERVI